MNWFQKRKCLKEIKKLAAEIYVTAVMKAEEHRDPEYPDYPVFFKLENEKNLDVSSMYGASVRIYSKSGDLFNFYASGNYRLRGDGYIIDNDGRWAGIGDDSKYAAALAQIKGLLADVKGMKFDRVETENNIELGKRAGGEFDALAKLGNALGAEAFGLDPNVRALVKSISKIHEDIEKKNPPTEMSL